MAEPDLSQYDPVFQAAGNEWNVDPTLLKAVAAQESGGRTNAVSSKNAQGLMQITPDTQKYLGVTDPGDPVQSIYGAAKYLSEGLDKEGSPEGALLYYHGGPGWRQAYGPESRAYVPGVTAHYVALKPPDQTQDAPAASTPQGPLILGDSLASKGGLGGTGVVGASPLAVLDNVNGLPGDQVNGRDVVLSSGASNNPTQAGLLEQQIKALQDKGAKSVTVVGVGDAPKLQGVNDGLAATAGRFGANFVPLDTTQLSPDRVHPTQQGYRTLLAAATPKVATDASPASSPAPASPQGQGKAMASSDLPSWLPPAPQASGGNGTPAAPAASTDSGGLPSWLPPAPQPSTASATTTDQPGGTTARGVARNVAAGVLEGSGGTINVLSDPVGNLIYRPLTTAGAAAYDWLAPKLGLPQMTPEQRGDLTGDSPEYQQPGTRMANALGASTVVPQSEAERLVRAGTAGATSALQLSPGGIIVPTAVGAGGGVGGQAAADYAPDWAKPYAQLGGMMVGGAAGGLAAAGLMRGGAATANALSQFASGPVDEHPLAPRPPIQTAAPTPMPTVTTGPISLEQLAAAVQRATPENWRPMAPGEDFVPGSEYRMNQTTGQREVNEGGPAGAQATPGSVAPAGAQQSAGAQPAGAQVTPTYEAIHTPAEEAAYRGRAEGQKLLEPQVIGERDLNQYIPGETANNAEREQTVKAARELKELGIRVPEASQLDKAAADSNNTARTIYLDNTTKGPVEINNERVQRQADIEADKGKVFAPENVTGPVNLQPVISRMEGVLDQPFNRQNTALQQAYRPWLDRLKAFSDGQIDNPEEAWGLRYDIDQQTDKFAQRDNPNMHRVAHNLADAADAIDTQIEKVAPGYADMLARYKEHSRAIDEMDVLQGAKDKFRGPGQKLTYNDFQRYMKNVVDSRMTPSTDLNPYKAISDENMQRLWNIRDSLRRTASAQELAKAAGSDTMPNIIDSLKAVGKMGGTAALHAYVGAHLGPGGNLALQSLGAIGKSLNDRRMIRRATTQMNQLLRPSEPLRLPPGQENPLSGGPSP